MKRLAVIAAIALSGCATTAMDGLVGQPLQVAMARYGQPQFVFDMPDGRRAFQWEMTRTGVIPQTTVSNANIYAPPGAFASVNSTSTTYGGGTVTNTCRYTMYARMNGNAWVFESYEQPRLGCL